MPGIDPSKLRKYKADADSAYSALNETSRRYRAAVDRVRIAETEVEKFKDGRSEVKGAALQMAERELKDARAGLRGLDAALTAASEVAEHAGRLWQRCRDYAAAHGALPDDLAN